MCSLIFDPTVRVGDRVAQLVLERNYTPSVREVEVRGGGGGGGGGEGGGGEGEVEVRGRWR